MANHVERVQSICDAVERGDVHVLLGALADNVEWNEAEHSTYWPGGPFVGTEAIVQGVFARIAQDFDGLRLHLRRVVGCGDTVVAEGRYTAIAKATGRRLDAQVAHIWDFKDGKVVRWQQYTDTWQFADVTGALPANG